MHKHRHKGKYKGKTSYCKHKLRKNERKFNRIFFPLCLRKPPGKSHALFFPLTLVLQVKTRLIIIIYYYYYYYCYYYYQNYHDLIKEQESNFDKVKFVNLSLSTLGVFGRASESFDDMLRNLKFDGQQSKFIKKKIVSTCIQTSYYIFCKRNKVWDCPKLMSI